MPPETDASEITAVTTEQPAVPAGWYKDPNGEGFRWWNGTEWTENVQVPQAPDLPPTDAAAPSQADIEAEAAARRAAEVSAAPEPVTHEAAAAVQVPVATAPSAPAAPVAAPEPPAPVVAPTAGTVPAAAPSAIPAAPATAEPAASKTMPADWPVKGYEGLQPWQAENPPMLTQNKLMLSSGMCGPEVVELASLLGYLGYETTISAGRNPHGAYDQGVSAAVESFCRDYGVEEDPAIRRARTPDTVGPWIWEAIVRAVHAKAEEAQAG